MCGILGALVVEPNNRWQQNLESALQALHHRGPDSRGTYSHNGLYIGHTRLAIHDLSDTGHQPMHSAHGNSSLVFNGEIYNFQTLKTKLPSHNFAGTSDTEVLLTYLDTYGVERTLTDIDGMFAFAYWHEPTKKLYLARDRMGEKPLYYSVDNGAISFASEFGALTELTQKRYEICDQAVNLMLRYGYIPAPFSIYKQIGKLLPGQYLSAQVNDQKIAYQTSRYFVPTAKPNNELTEQQVITDFEAIMAEAVEQRLLADVPVGAFLSGGIDSSLVAAIATSVLGKKIDTFTIGFDESAYDESGFARDVAQHLGCPNHVQIVTQQHMLSVVSELPRIYGEPFADSSQIPTLALCQQTKADVTVAISGDGGDELFAGYSRYQHLINRWRGFNQLGSGFKWLNHKLSRQFDGALLKQKVAVNNKEKLRRMMRYAGAEQFSSFYSDSVSATWQTDIEQAQLPMFSVNQSDELRQVMSMDLAQYLPDDILVKVDRASMAHSLEVRVPLLANQVVDYSLSLPNHLLVKEGKTKWPMRKLLYQYVPESLIERPKKGFAVPIAEWLRSDLKEWATSLIFDSSLREKLTSVDHSEYQFYWLQHQQGTFNWSTQLWHYLQLLNWLKHIEQ